MFHGIPRSSMECLGPFHGMGAEEGAEHGLTGPRCLRWSLACRQCLRALRACSGAARSGLPRPRLHARGGRWGQRSEGERGGGSGARRCWR
eukprot:1393828-Rhodomonas_salina.1